MSLGDAIGETNKKATDAGEEYLKSSYEYYKLKIFQQLTITISIVFKAILIGGFLITAIGFLSLALALYIGKLLNDYTLGFLIIGFVLLLLAFIVFLMKKRVNDFVVDLLSEKFFN